MAGTEEIINAIRNALNAAQASAAGGIAPQGGATAAEFSAARFGGPIKLKDTTVTIGTTVTELLKNNPKRVFWLAINRGSNDGAIGFSNLLTTASGIPVSQGGGAVSMSVDEDGEPVAWSVTAIVGTAAGSWSVFEIERV